MNRRKFLQLSTLSSTGAMLLNGHQVNAFSQTDLVNSIPASVVDGRTIVLVQLTGGNDGLNTVIPQSQYDEYARLRPTIRLKESGTGAAIPLDSSLDDAQKLLIHPSCTGLKSLYDEGKLNVIHSVGYPQLNKSHFASRALMFQGGDGTPENSTKTDGWMARFLNSAYDYTQYQDPLGIQLGSQKPSLGFQSSHEHKVDLNLAGQDVSGYYNVVSNIGNPVPEIPESDYGDALSYISNIESGINTYSQRISEVFNLGLSKRNAESTVNYPSNNKLADQLKTVATLIRGGSKTKVFLVSYDGFDTHGSQVQSQTETHKGKHADLLKSVGDALKFFQDDLKMLGIEDKVVSATFTEFGRKPAENGNLGTDHGNLGPMFVIGKHVKGGVTGTNLDLSEVTEHYDQTIMQHDYRQVFTSIISGYLGATDKILTDTEFGEFSAKKLNLIEESQKTDGSLSVDDVLKDKLISLSENPVSSSFTISYVSSRFFRGKIELKSIAGSSVFSLVQDFAPRLNRVPVNITHVVSGVYILVLYDEDHQSFYRQKIIKQ
ncbi:uncharacterized protein (DUF1501 family) [Wenyingzhuangia heitensis]|uniref:Uncharacterized protein (DUF1501 family) n=1 Tax=Wenyingzhuangia heitensis TaxID=1487859 RepID=A0ABX0UA99_9FLAO|nr:DUF1501 domain-containing protein [Wenyingzhuangia heitensis]NIJ44086.1 uncharacterized protein (DUF1501 family) [Wenyingzhuangia heitensis]